MTTNLTDSSADGSLSASATSADVAPSAPSVEGGAISLLRQLGKIDLGSIPVFVGLILIAIYFQVASGGFFLTPQNLTNLVQQVITTGAVSLGAVLVLLIGEIDLSLSAVAFLGGGIMGVLSAKQGLPAYEAVGAALLAGLLIGAINGVLVAVVRIPSFIVTLAAFIFYQGFLVKIMEPQTSLQIIDDAITGVARNYFPDTIGLGVPIVAVVIYALGLLLERTIRLRAGLPVKSWGQIGLRIGIVTAATAAILVAFEAYQGVPVVALILVGLIVVFWLITRRTRFGRHLYAVGGNAEAARRAGINVAGLRIVVFSLASMLAVIGGMLLASRQSTSLTDVDKTLLLNAIAAAVIGGVSLFGGRGSVWAVALGCLVIGSLNNGLNLLNQPAAVYQMVEGAVLLLAVLVDAFARRRNATGLR
jgi:D-xylose transport system permease protein